MTRLCLVRHGETAWNAERRLQGHVDVPLNETGLEQACATADALATHAFSALYCSDLARARQTAQATAIRIGLTPTTLTGLRERHYGVFQGLTYDEAANRFPQAYARFQRRDIDFAIPEGGESLSAFSRRVSAALDDIARRHAGEPILIVTHGGVLDVAHRIATGKPLDTPRDFEIPNAALNWIEHRDGIWKLIAWAERSHLVGSRDELPHG
ncbi:histidine phosphatase family protein [Rhodocyclaceae bacterium SMB388]